jgi:hypothetical protein
VLGRKNWLFAGSEAAAHRTAILCSLVQTCKHLQINPFVYLRDVIESVSPRLGTDATRVEAPAAGFRRTSRRLNGVFRGSEGRLFYEVSSGLSAIVLHQR